MLKIWVVLYFAGRLVAAWGPITNFQTVDQCIGTISQYNQLVVRGSSVRITCVSAVTPPLINSR
jgi:hypothetical protein